jgi:hypothetical protein
MTRHFLRGTIWGIVGALLGLVAGLIFGPGTFAMWASTDKRGETVQVRVMECTIHSESAPSNTDLLSSVQSRWFRYITIGFSLLGAALGAGLLVGVYLLIYWPYLRRGSRLTSPL